MEPIGLYIHVPFCASKCPYCDFYSIRAGEELWDAYTTAICAALRRAGSLLRRPAGTLYFGGGTPSLLGGERLAAMVSAARSAFQLDGAQITVECNPASADERLLDALAGAGVNRVSFGMQSAVDEERRSLGRRSTAQQVRQVVERARRAGIYNLSLDLMLGIPGQTAQSLEESLSFVLSLGVPHVSAYLLKLEEGTVFYRRRTSLSLPEEDEVCDFYLSTVKRLEESGLRQYEVSNFSKPGFKSVHNLNYWLDKPYLGLGPSAHSFLDGKRFYFTDSLEDYLRGTAPVADGTGGGFEEFAMLRLRLSEGLTHVAVRERFGHGVPPDILRRARPMAQNKLLVCDDKGIRLTPEGFLLSNTVIGRLLF